MVKLFLRISILLLFLFSLGLVSLWGQKESVKTGLWSEADTWSPPGVPSTSDAVTIKPGHLVTINSGITVNVGVLTVEGALEVLSSSVTFGANSQVTPTGIYRHGVNGGTVGGTAPAHITWALGSTLEVTGVTDAITITAAQSYHHVVWNCVGQTSTLAFNNNFQTIGGDLKFEHTGSGRVNFSDVFQSLIYTISRDLVVSQSARISLRSNDNTGNSFNLPTLKIGRSLLNNSDQVDAFTSCDNCSTQSHRGYASIEFTGIGTLNLGNISTTGNVGYNNNSWRISFKNGSNIKCLSDIFLGNQSLTNTGDATRTFLQIESGGSLDLDVYSFKIVPGINTNQKRFELFGGGFLAQANQHGISTNSSSSGAVQTAGETTGVTITYSDAATYIYKGTADQVTGNGLPDQATIRVDKTSGKTLTIPAGKPLKLDGIKGGTLVLGNNTLTIPNLVESGGDIDATSGTLVFTNDVALSIPSGSWTVNTLTRNNTSNVTLSGSFGLTLTGIMTGDGSLLFAEEAVLILENGGDESAPAPVPDLPYNQLSLGGEGKHYNLPPGLAIAQNLEVGAGATVNLPGGPNPVTINNGISLRGTLKGGSAPISLCGNFILEVAGASYNPGSGGLVLKGRCGQGGPPQKIRKSVGDPTLSLGKVTISSDEGIEFEFGEDGQTSGTIIVGDLEFGENGGIIKIKKNFLKINGSLTGGGFGPNKFIAVEGDDKSAYGKLGRGIPTSSFESLNYLLFPIGRLDGTTSIYSPVEIAVESTKSNFEPLIGAGFYPSYPTSTCWDNASLVPLSGESPVNHEYLQATWDISPEIIAEWEKNTDKAYVKLLLQENGDNKTLSGGSLFIAHCFTSPLPSGPAYELLPANLDGNSYSFSLDPITEFSEFIIGQDMNLMPVELLFFKSQLEGIHAKLQWATASEHQSDFFEVQRSSNGSTWETIGKVPAQGNSVVRKNYEWMDTNPYRGWSYYRLWQQDWDGSGSFYGPVSLQFGKASEVFEIYPTLVESELSLSRRSFTSELSYFLTDGRGNRLISGKFPSGNTSHSLSLAHLSTGLYFLHIQNGKEISNHKIYKK